MSILARARPIRRGGGSGVSTETPAWDVLVHAIGQSEDGVTATTPPRDTRGARTIMVNVAAGNAVTVSDPLGNVYVPIAAPNGTPHTQWYECINPITDEFHTCEATGPSSAPTIAMVALVGTTEEGDPVDDQNGDFASSAVSIQPGPVVASQTYDMLLTACAINETGRMPFGIDDGFDILDFVDFRGPPYAYGLAIAIKPLTASGAVDEHTWTTAAAQAISSAVVLVKSSRGSPPPGDHFDVTVGTTTPIAGSTVPAFAQFKRPDGTNAPTQGITVTWSKTGGGVLGGTTSVTDVNGRASMDMATSATAGDVETITATDGSGHTGTSPSMTTTPVPTGGPDEPAGFVMHSYFDPSHPSGFNQPGWRPNSGGRPNAERIIDWAPGLGGKGAELRMPPHFRALITSIAPGTGPYAGKMIIVAPNAGLDFFDTAVGKNPHYENSASGNPIGIWGVTPYSLGQTARIGNDARDVTALDADTLLINHDLASDPSWSGGAGWTGDGVAYVGVFAGSGWSAFATLYDWNAMYNTGHYLIGLFQMGEDDGSDYDGNTGSGGTKFGFGTAQSRFRNDFTGAKAYPGPQGDQTDEASPVMMIFITGADSYQGYDIPTGPQNITAGKGINPLGGVFYPDLAQRGDAEYVRGVPKTCEVYTLSDSGGGAKDGDIKVWFDPELGNPVSIHCNNIRFGLEPGATGVCMRGFHVPSWDDVEGGGGIYSKRWKRMKIGYIYQSVGYPIPGTRPHHWEMSVDNPTPSVGDPVVVTGTLVDENGNRVMSCVNNTPYGAGAPYGDAVVDTQMDADNDATWAVVANSWGDDFPITGELLHASTVPGASYSTAHGGPIYSVKVYFGGVEGTAGVDFEVSNYNAGTIHILPGTAKTGAVTIDYSSLAEVFNRLGKISLRVQFTNPGDTTIRIRDIGRALNYQRYGAWREGSVTLEVRP